MVFCGYYMYLNRRVTTRVFQILFSSVCFLLSFDLKESKKTVVLKKIVPPFTDAERDTQYSP